MIPIGLFIDLSSFFVKEEMLPTIHFTAIDDVIIYAASTEKPLYMIDLLTWFYLIGVLTCLLFLIYKLYKLYMAMQYVSVDSSFSFFKKVVLGSKVKDIQEINIHERVHVEQGHSYDIVFMELLSVFNWFNPVVYFIKKELKFQHECIADEICSTDKVSYAELLLAHAMQTDVNMLRHEFSNQSFLKKRIMMLFKNKSTKNKKYLYLSTLPLLTVVALSTLLFNTSKAKAVVKNIENKIEEVKVNSDKNNLSSEILPSEYLQEDTTKKRRNNKQDANSSDLIFKTTEILAEPPGGMTAFRQWIEENYQYPQAAIDEGVKGTVVVSFIVEKDGSLSDIKNDKDLGFGTGEAAVELMKKAPKWLPAIQNARKERLAYTLPIKLDVIFEQENKTAETSANYERVEIMAEPKGGMSAFRKFIGQHFIYPQSMIDAKESGSINLYFEIDKEGNPVNFKVLNESNIALSKSFIATIEKFGTWEPAILNGKKVGSRYSLDIKLTYSGFGIIEVGSMKIGDFIKS